MARSILVLGIGCSGTSATAGVIHKLGVPMGLPGHLQKHPAGFDLFEDRCFYGQTCKDPTLFEKTWREHRREPIFGIKNTILGLQLEWILPIIKNLGDEPRAVVVHRQALASMEGRAVGKCPPGETFSQKKAIRWWLQATEKLTGQLLSTDVMAMHIQFEGLLKDPCYYTRKIAEFVFEDMDYPGGDIILKASNHIEKRPND